MLPSNVFLWLLSGSLASAASEITNIKYSNLSISPLTAQRYPSEGWQATFDFDISDASSIAVGDYFTLSLPYVYRIKLGGSSGSESMIINLDIGSSAFKCSVTQQAAYLYQDSILTCEALMSFSDYSSLAGQLSFSVNFDAGGSVYKYEMEDASFFKAGGMQVPFGSQMSTEVVFDKVPLPDYYYTFGRTTGYGTAQIYYLDMFCPNGYLLGGTETINFDNRNGGFNIDCSSLQTYLSKNFNDFLLPLDVESNTPDNICYGNTVQVTVDNAGEGAMLFINVLQDVHDGDQSIEHSISIHYSCMDTLAHTTYTTDVDRLYVYDIYNGADSGTITATQSITASSISTTSSSSSAAVTSTSSSTTSSSSASSSPSSVTSGPVASTKSPSTSSSLSTTTSSSVLSIRRIVTTTQTPSSVKSSSSISSTTELLTSIVITSSQVSTSSIPSSTTIASTTPKTSTTVFTLSTTPNMRISPSPSPSSSSSTSSATSTSSTPEPIAISRVAKSSVEIPLSMKSPISSSVPTYSVSSTLPLATRSLTEVSNTLSTPSHSETLAATSLVPTSSTSVHAIRQVSPSSSSRKTAETSATMNPATTATSSNPESSETSLTTTTRSEMVESGSSNVSLVPIAATTLSTILVSFPVTQSPSGSPLQKSSSIKISNRAVPSSTYPAVRSEIAQPKIIFPSTSSASQVIVNTVTHAPSSESTSLLQTTTVDSIQDSSSKSTSSMAYIKQKSVAHSVVSFSQANVAATPTTGEPAASLFFTTSNDVNRANNKPVQETSDSHTLVVVTITSDGAVVLTKEATEQTHITSENIRTTENVSPASVSTVFSTTTSSGDFTETSTSVVMEDVSANTVSVDVQTLESTTTLTSSSNFATTATIKTVDSVIISSENLASTTVRTETTGSAETIASSPSSQRPSSPTVTEKRNTHSQTQTFTGVTPTTVLQQADTVSSSTQTIHNTLMTSAVSDTSFEPLVPAFTGLGSRLHVSVFSPMLLISILSFFLM